MSTLYEYTKSPVDIDSLRIEILSEPAITTYLEYISFNKPDMLDVMFSGSLSPQEKTSLDDVVTSHSGIPTYIPLGYVALADGNGGLYFDSGIPITLSGSDPVGPKDLTTKEYVDGTITTVSGDVTYKIDNKTFTSLIDTPFTYATHGNKFIKVAANETGLEFSTISGGMGVDHSILSNLSYATSGHTGFASSAININTVSGIQGGGNLTADRTLSLNINGLSIDDTPHIEDYLVTYDSATETHRKITVMNASIAISSLAYVYAESDGASTTSNGTYQDKTILTASGILAGTYRLLYTCEYQASANNKDVSVRVYDDTNAVVYAENSQQTNNNLNWFTLSGFKRLTLTGGTIVIKWQYRAGTANCTIRRARLELRRVS